MHDTSLATEAIHEINERHAKMNDLAKDALGNAIRIGELLTEQRKRCKHGEWLPWLKANVRFTQQTANNYMRLYEGRSKLQTVGNLAEAYRLTFPSKRTVKTHAPKPHPASVEVMALVDQGLSQAEIATKTGHSQRTIRQIVEHGSLRREGAGPAAEIVLSMSAKQKADAYIQRWVEGEKARLAGMFFAEVNARIADRWEGTLGPKYRAKIEWAERIISRRAGIMSKKEYNQIRKCLHADKTPTEAEKHEAFLLITGFEKELLREEEHPAKNIFPGISDIPTTLAELDALKKKASEERKAKRAASKANAVKTF